MGLLDNFGNLSPEQTQGLLGFAANMLQAGGSSLRPTSFGQALGAGLQGFQGGMDAATQRKLQLEQAQQAQQLHALQIQEAQSALQDRTRTRAQEAEIQRAAQQAYQTPGAQAASLGGGPTQENAAQIPSMSGGFDQDTFINRVMQIDPMKGLALKQQYAKQAPKVKDWKEVQIDGKTMYAPLFENGTAGQPVPYEAAVKLQFQNVGGKTLALNPFSGAQVSAYQNSQSPDSAAGNVVTMRGQNLTNQRAFDQLHAPQFNAELGGFVTRPTADAPGGMLTPLAGYQKPDKPLTESQGKAGLFASRMDRANQTITELAAAGVNKPSMIKTGLGSLPLVGGALGGLGNWAAASADQQKVEQAQNDFISAVLRQESGAVIGAEEAAAAKQQYFPQPGDEPGVIAQKAANRQTAIQGMSLMAGPGAKQLGVGQSQGAAQPVRKSALKGQVIDGYRFKGGDPADQNSWEKI